MSLHISIIHGLKVQHVPMSESEEEVCLLQELLALTDAAQLFEQIPLLAIANMRAVDWTIITVSPPCHFATHLLSLHHQATLVTAQDACAMWLVNSCYSLHQQAKCPKW